MSLFRRKKTVKQAMMELTAADGFGAWPLMQVDWLSDGEYTFQKGSYEKTALLCGLDLYGPLARLYDGRRELDKAIVINKKEVETLRKENDALKKTIAEQKKEIDRLSQPQGRKILVDQKEPA